MKFLSILFFIISGFLFINGSCRTCRVKIVSATKTFFFKEKEKSPEELKRLKKIEKYLGYFSDRDFENNICNLGDIFRKSISKKTSLNYTIRFNGKKTSKNGQIKQIYFLLYNKDAIRFLIKNRNKFHLRIEKDLCRFYGKKHLLFTSK